MKSSICLSPLVRAVLGVPIVFATRETIIHKAQSLGEV